MNDRLTRKPQCSINEQQANIRTSSFSPASLDQIPEVRQAVDPKTRRPTCRIIPLCSPNNPDSPWNTILGGFGSFLRYIRHQSVDLLRNFLSQFNDRDPRATANLQEMGQSPALIYDSPKFLIPVRYHISGLVPLKPLSSIFPLLSLLMRSNVPHSLQPENQIDITP